MSAKISGRSTARRGKNSQAFPAVSEAESDESTGHAALAKRLPSLPALLREVYSESISQKQYNEAAYDALNPPLSLYTTLPHNFTNFLVKTGPVSRLDLFVKDIVFWREPRRTVCAMGVFTLFCIQPNLLFVTPLLLAIVLISAKYFGTAEAKGAAPRNMALNGNTATNSPEAVPSCEGANLERIARELAESLVASQPKGGPKPPDPPTSFHVARALVTADPQIHLNATFNQNTTGSYCLLYDYCVAHSHLVDWSYPQYTRLILIGLVGLQALLMLVLYWVPFWLAVMVAGNTALLLACPLVRAAGIVTVPIVWTYSLRTMALARRRALLLLGRDSRGPAASDVAEAVPPPRQKVISEENAGKMESVSEKPRAGRVGDARRQGKTAVVYENQRWWAMLGWVPRMFSRERAPWSDETGTMSFPSLDTYPPDPGYEWAPGSSWRVHVEHGGNGEAFGRATDADGWVYTNNNWRKPRACAVARSFTRRRRWEREMVLAEVCDSAGDLTDDDEPTAEKSHLGGQQVVMYHGKSKGGDNSSSSSSSSSSSNASSARDVGTKHHSITDSTYDYGLVYNYHIYSKFTFDQLANAL